MDEQMQMQAVLFTTISGIFRSVQVILSRSYLRITQPLSNEAIKMPSMSEEAAIEGLKFFVELFGQYPKKLDMINLMQEFVAPLKDNKSSGCCATAAEIEAKEAYSEEEKRIK